jgi:predicted acylesterase/phospholipase RssA
VLDAFLDLSQQHTGLIDLVGPFEKDSDGETVTPAGAVETVTGFKDAGSTILEAFNTRKRIGKSGWFLRNLCWWLPYVNGYLKLQRIERLANRAIWAWNHRGVFTGVELQHFLDQLLRLSPLLQPNEHLLPPPARDVNGQTVPGGRWLTFRDIREVQDKGWIELSAQSTVSGVSNKVRPYFPPLILAATEVTTRRLELINSIEPHYLDWPVVKAVRASAGFPGFFTPVDHDAHEHDLDPSGADPGPAGGERSYVDGGVIANFPAFVFGSRFRRWLAEVAAAHRPIYAAHITRPWVHVGLRLMNTRQARPPAGARKNSETFVLALLDLFKGLARSELEDRLSEFIPRSIPLGIEFDRTGGPDGVLDVDSLRPHIVRTMFDQGYIAARDELYPYRFNLPASGFIECILYDMIDRAWSIFPPAPGTKRDPKFRSNVFVPQGAELVLTYRAFMDDPSEGPADRREANTDRDLRLNLRHGLSGLCYASRRALLLNMERLQTAIAASPEPDPKDKFGLTQKKQSEIRLDRTWLVSVPIFDPETTLPGRLHALPLDVIGGCDYAEAMESPIDVPVNDDGIRDGAAFGVLNLDAGWDYSAVDLNPDPSSHRIDRRIRALVDIIRVCATRIGTVFSRAFPHRMGNS